MNRADAVAGGEAQNWVNEHGDYLFRYAYSRVLDAALAEDLVQETLVAALAAVRRFAGRSSVRTWLVSILRNKIVDHFRKVARHDRESLDTFYRDEAAAHFDAAGHWDLNRKTTPSEWAPKQESEVFQRELREQLEQCLRRLPPRVREVFVLREMEDFTTEEICHLLGINRQNLWSVMHRARMALRDCVDVHWVQVLGGS